MRKHLKRQGVPKTWPIPRKGSTFVIKNNSKGLPLLVALRDVLKIAQNRKEVKAAVHKKDLLICQKIVTDEKRNVELFDTITIIPGNKNYRLTLSEFGKYSLEEISEKDAKEKVTKIIGKKTLKGKKKQINLEDGKNYLFDKSCKVNDSVVVNLEKNEIKEVLPLKEKVKIVVTGGKHSGAIGVIEKLNNDLKIAEVKSEDKKFNVLIKQMMVVN